MADVGKVRGARGPEPTGPKKKKGPDSDHFREMMKVGKVRETDPEEKRKRKKQAEAEEEMKAEQTGSVPRQGMEPEPKEPPPFQAEPGKGPVGAAEGAGPPAAEPPPPYTPPEQKSEEQPQFPREQHAEPKKKTEKADNGKTKKKKKVTGPVPEVKKLKTPPVAPHKKEPRLEETKALFKKMGKPDEVQPEKKKKKKEPEAGLPAPLPPGAWEATKAPEKDKKKEVGGPEIVPTTTPTPTAAPPAGTPEPPPLIAPFANLPPQVQKIFERMVGVMTVMTNSGITQTTINLDNPRFAESVFFGAQIIISEFSTAPKAFNIEILGNQQAVNLMNANAEELVAAFQAGNYNFKVNRIDTGHLPAMGEAKRKQVRRVGRKKPKGG